MKHFSASRLAHGLALLLLLAVSACSCPPDSGSANCIYYWRTTFSLNKAERAFLLKHNVRKIYLRFFDVSNGFTPFSDEPIRPEATIQFYDSVPAGIEIVPTIYITVDAMERMKHNEPEYAEKIMKRIKAICRRNNVKFSEVQLDCDWTKGTRQPFFRLCEAMKKQMDSTQTLSSTIRLHQLKQTPPPVDRGVLMVYNTGNLMELTTENSIFSPKDIEPYLRDNRLAEYPLALDVAYPVYSWSLEYYPAGDKYRFSRIMRRTDFSSYPALKKIGDNLYEATATVNVSDNDDRRDNIYKGYRVRVERPSSHEILAVKKLIDSRLKGKKHNNILYHLDHEQLNHYSDHEISKIYSRN